VFTCSQCVQSVKYVESEEQRSCLYVSLYHMVKHTHMHVSNGTAQKTTCETEG
jgi:hypothetical protein